MIISHKLKVIFLKNHKTASSSFELALSKYCGPDDIYTSIGSDTDIRRSFNIPQHQNNIAKGKRIYKQHVTAYKIKKTVLQNIWDNYLKVSIVRCPYDMTISQYYWGCYKKRENCNLGFNQWLLAQVGKNFRFAYKVSCINNRSVIDFVIRYENLNEDIKKLEIKIGCSGLLQTFQNIKNKSDSRPSGKDIYTVYSKNPLAKRIVDMKCQNSMGDGLFARYYPIYKERLNQKITHPEPRYVSFLDDLIYEYSYFKKCLKKSRNRISN